MQKGKAFLIIGHRDWGKSRTLRVVVGGGKMHHAIISGKRVFVRMMSNDDHPEDYVTLIKSLRPSVKKYVIAAFCPKLDNGEAEDILDRLSKGYEIFSFVLLRSFKDERTIKAEELKVLKRYGRVEVFAERAEARERAASFIEFVERAI